MKKYLLEIIVFISGAALMIFELVGSRIFAPYLGTSLVVWTSLIGIIMGSLSIGYYVGGRLADRKAQYKILALIVFSSAIAVSLATASQYFVLSLLQGTVQDLRLGSVIASIILFAPASIIFGMVSPYAIKLKLDSLKNSGEKIGEMYAVSTVGSIAGTFLGGFFLMPMYGTVKILFILIVVLILTSIFTLIVEGENFKKKDFLIIILFSSLFIGNSVFGSSLGANMVDIDTQYNRVLIFETLDPQTKRPIRGYTTDPHGAQSAIFLDNDNDLVFDYLKYYRLAEHFNSNLKNSLMIGGGAFTYPRDYLKRNPEASLDIVEIDERLESIAKQYFNFTDNERVKIYNQDGRIFLNENKKTYDCIFMDAYNSQFSIPFQLTTLETIEKLYNSLNSDGIVLANVISAIDGENGKFLRAEIATYKKFFPQVYIFPVKTGNDSSVAQNILLVALKSKEVPRFESADEDLNKYLKNLWTKKIEMDMPVLTDDYAPVDYYTMSML